MSGTERLEDALRFYEDQQAGQARKSPFKLLDPYEVHDRKIFFGRDAEIEDVRTRYYRSQVFVVYGESGSGKTSLVQCGLDAAVPAEDADFFFIRSNEDAMAEVRDRIGDETTGADESLISLVRARAEASSKTVVLVFDQFEELFIFQGREERARFFEQIAEALGARLDLKVIFIIREEYFARMTEAEQRIPRVFENRYWLRKMGAREARKVIEGPCREFGVEIEDGLPQAILDRLADPRGEIDLPYLQIMLDRIYNHALERGEPVRLKLSDLEQMGEMVDILSDFLEGRVAALEDPFFGRDLLKQFVTSLGTKKPVQLNEIIPGIREAWPERGIDDVRRLLFELVEARILRQDESEAVFELRHDALAAAISKWLSPFEEELIEVRGYFEDRLSEWRRSGALIESRSSLARVEQLLPYLRSDEAAHELLDQSRTVLRAAMFRRTVFTFVIPIVLAAGVVLALLLAWNNARRASLAEAESESHAVAAEMLRDEIEAIASYSKQDWAQGDSSYQRLRAANNDVKVQTDLVFAQVSWLLAFGNGAGCHNLLRELHGLLVEDSRYWRVLGACALVDGEAELAAEHLEKIAADSDDPCTLVDLSLAYALSGEMGDAWTTFATVEDKSDVTPCLQVSLRRLDDLRNKAEDARSLTLYEALLSARLGRAEAAKGLFNRFLEDPTPGPAEVWQSLAQKRLAELLAADGTSPDAGTGVRRMEPTGIVGGEGQAE